MSLASFDFLSYLKDTKAGRISADFSQPEISFCTVHEVL
ncbi:hypothetical protein STRMA_0935 [Streptococcus macacae NCTC 11558]|uniref:Uncharacterized protein n=1 Tax=Streptococcus macacae NCTC 11558 TaxID=764298 RepID=G5JWG3_9STRE|nr:hypothetical protein STRMA_0935 [Streptococcus macacae NCTC 11558]